MKACVKIQDPSQEFPIPEGCHILELSNSADDPELSIARARVAPGVTTQWHRLKGTTERYVILQGKGLVEVGDLPAQAVKSGDVVIIPPECPQRISNSGKEDLIFLALCTPRFTEVYYERLLPQ
jgi:mannose-6-phosphate isomerase-like protein (cupin superfamily)